MNYKEQISNNKLRYLRKTLGIRQQDVADILNFCTTDRISHWEKGQAIPNLVNLFRLCAIYQVYPHELYPNLFGKVVDDVQANARSQASAQLSQGAT